MARSRRHYSGCVPWRKLILASSALLLLACAGTALVWHRLPTLLAGWVSGPGFNRMLSKAVSDALKVDGTFGPLELQPGLCVAAENFTSKGWPGQAIGALDATRARGWFDPWGVFRGEWRVPRIDIEQAEFRLVNPDDALKSEDPVPRPKPWYASLMPSQFSCGWIECPDMSIELPLGTEKVRGESLRMGAMMIGRNFKYFGRNGTLRYPGYPALAIDAMEVYVTREVIDIGNIYLREPAAPKSNLFVSARLGQHADKSIRAKAEITSLDLRPFLPTDIAKVLSGRLSGNLTYQTGTNGGNAAGGGSLLVENAKLSGWDYLDRLATKAGDPSLRQLAFRRVSLDYALAGDVFTVSNLAVTGLEQIDLRGRGSWNMVTDTATASLAVSRIPVKAYLPTAISDGLNGQLSGNVDWTWGGTKLLGGRGGGSLQLTGAALKGFDFQKFLARFLKNKSYTDLPITHASLNWRQDGRGLVIDDLLVLAGDRAGLRGSVRVTDKGVISGVVKAGLPAASLTWLPEATKTVFSEQKDGLHWCSVKLWGTERKPENDFTAQVMKQLDKHPFALAALALRGLSWWLGDVLKTVPASEEG